MTDPAVARKIATTGWTTVLLGALCLFTAAVQLAAPPLLRRLTEGLETARDPSQAAREAWVAGASQGAGTNLLFGLGLVAIGIAVTRRVRWSHAALTAAGWMSLVAIVVMTKPTLSPLLDMAGVSTGRRAITWGVTALLIVGQVVAMLWFLRFWKRAEIREAFTGPRSTR
jgi:hypothetical protein